MAENYQGKGRKPVKPRLVGGTEGPPSDGGDPPPHQVDGDSCPVTALGRRTGHYWFFSPSGEERELSYRQLFKLDGLQDLFEGRLGWLYANFRGDQGGLSVTRAGNWLVRACVDAGLFDSTILRRGPGVWRDGAALIVHCGDQVLIDGEWFRAGFRQADFLYPLAAKLERPAAQPATVRQAANIYKGLGLWNFDDVMAANLLMGFIGLAHLGAAPDWRVHIFVRAPYGSGKTWLAEFVAWATGARPPANNITPAAIYQGLTGEARAIVIDEAEKSERDDRISEVLKIIRLMSGRGGANIQRGSAEGKATSYNLAGAAFLTAILHPVLQPQDRSRFAMLRLRPLASGPAAIGQQERALKALDYARTIAPALKARAIAGWPRFLDTVAVYRAAAMTDDVEPRSADSISALLAGYDLMMRDDVPTPAEAAAEIAKVAHMLVRETDRAQDGEGEQCLAHMLSSHVETYAGGERMTVGEEIAAAQLPGAARSAIHKILARCGLTLVYDRTVGQSEVVVLLVARHHVGLDRIFQGTRWSGGVWRQALEDLPGASTWGTVRFAGAKSQRCTALPVDSLPGPNDDAVIELGPAAGDDIETD